MSTHRRFTRSVAGALALAAIAAPTAGALPAEQVQGGSASGSPSSVESKAAAPAPTVTRTIDEGFDVGSAAIGAGSAAAFLLVAGAGVSAMVHRHRRLGIAR